MARVAWSFDGYDWPVNPAEDTGWQPNVIFQEQVPINSFKSRIQIPGGKSDTRQITGWVVGINGPDLYSNLYNWAKQRKQATLTDHLGDSRRAMITEFRPQKVQDMTEWREGRQTYRYTITFIAVD